MKYFILFKKKSLKVCHSTIYIFFFFISWEGNFILRVSLEADYHMFFCLSLSLCLFFPSQTQCLTPGETPGLIDVEERSACHTPRCN